MTHDPARLSAPVRTPIGIGTYEGAFSEVAPGTTAEGEPMALVRLPVNEATAPHIRAANCLTPHANLSGLWLFDMSEVEAVR